MSQSNELRVVRLNPSAVLPVYGSSEAAGMDISSCVDGVILPGDQQCIPTGLAFQIPKGFVGMLKERSGLSFNKRLALGAGIIDSDFRGESKVILRNGGGEPFHFKAGDRLAQMLILACPQWNITEIPEEFLKKTTRGGAGFGSTGIVPIVKTVDESIVTSKRKREETEDDVDSKRRREETEDDVDSKRRREETEDDVDSKRERDEQEACSPPDIPSEESVQPLA